MDISCQFATSLRSAEHIANAEALGYERAWLFDTPAQSPDVWAMLALAAQQTSRIALGPGVLVPTLRHPMVNASGAAMLSALAPGRVAVAFGTGFNGTRALGAKPATWSYLTSYMRTFRVPLRGEAVEWDHRPMRMLHPADHAPARPLELPVLISALGPQRGGRHPRDRRRSVHCQQPDRPRTRIPLGSARVRAAAGPGLALAYHATYEFAATSPGYPAYKAGSRSSTPNPSTNATSPYTTNTSADSTRPTTRPGPPGVGTPSPSRPSPDRQRASPNNSPTTPSKASPKSRTNPLGPTSSANSNASSRSPKKSKATKPQQFDREEWL